MQLRLQAILPETTDISSFIFIPETPISWQAGQSIRLELPVGYDLHERRFTIASAPREEVVRITTHRSNSSFKKALWGLKVNETVQAFSIEGSLTWQQARRCVFLAGGMGITPFRALIVDNDSPRSIELTHSSRNGYVFADEFIAKQTAGGILYRQLDRRIEGNDVPFYEDADYYVAGPREMVKGLTEVLKTRGVEPRKIIYDVFTGY